MLKLLLPLLSLHCTQGMGISVDDDRNKATVGGEQGDISASDSRIKVLVIPTDEELSIAQQTLQVVDQIKSRSKSKVAVAA
jgi:acetate kinase